MKAQTITLSLIFFCILYSCNQTSIYKENTKNYGLTGKVKSFEERYYRTTCDNNWNIIDDNNGCFSTIYNFDSNGVIQSIYQNNCSTSSYKTIYNPNSTKILCRKFDGNGELLTYTEFASFKDSIFETRDMDAKTNKILSYNFTKYKNDRIVWYRKIDSMKIPKIQAVYTIDKKGLEVDIHIISKSGKNKNNYLQKIKYLEFDSMGNWIKRIDYWPSFKGDCLKTTRKITYYN